LPVPELLHLQLYSRKSDALRIIITCARDSIASIGMAYVFLDISPTPELAVPIYRSVATMLGVTLAYSLVWTLRIMHRSPFQADLAGFAAASEQLGKETIKS
jgi:hypothetical protein